MIYKMVNDFVVTCDNCSKDVHEVFSTWDEAFEYLMVNGWKTNVTRKGCTFKHICPDCQEEPLPFGGKEY